MKMKFIIIATIFISLHSLLLCNALESSKFESVEYKAKSETGPTKHEVFNLADHSKFKHPKYTDDISTYKEGDRTFNLHEANKVGLESPALYNTVNTGKNGNKNSNNSNSSSSSSSSSTNSSYTVSSSASGMKTELERKQDNAAKYESPVSNGKEENFNSVNNSNSNNNNNNTNIRNTNTPSSALTNNNNNNNSMNMNMNANTNASTNSNSDEPLFMEVNTIKKSIYSSSNSSKNSNQYRATSSTTTRAASHATIKNNLKFGAEKVYDFDAAKSKDIEKLLSQFENSKDKRDKASIIIDGKNRLLGEVKQLKQEVKAEMEELIAMKNNALLLNNIVNRYTMKMMKDRKNKITIADEIEIKGILTNKLQRDLQGFRSSPEEYKELDVVNQADIIGITDQVEKAIKDEIKN